MSDLAAASPLHLGALHPVELLLVLLVGFGPFVVLAVVAHVVRRREPAREEHHPGCAGSADTEAGRA